MVGRALHCSLVMIGIGLLSCSPGPVENLRPTPNPPDKKPLECGLGELPDQLTTTSGGRVSFSVLSDTATDIHVEVPSDWRLSEVETGSFTIRVPYSASGTSSLKVIGRCGDDEIAAELSVQVTTSFWTMLAAWNEGPETPRFRQLPDLWVDPSMPGDVLMFGGYDPRNGFTPELWSFYEDKQQWTLLSALDDLQVFGSSDAAMIPGEQAIVFFDVFGGWSGTNSPFSMIRMDYGGEQIGWTELSSRQAPTLASHSGAFVYDAKRDRYISACGIAEDQRHCEVMTYDLSRGEWSRPAIAAGDAPSGRYGFAYALDEENDRLVIFSGGQEPSSQGNLVNAAQDTWALDLSEEPMRWTKLFDDDASPIGRRNSCFALDKKGHRLIVWGGTTDAQSVIPALFSLDLDRGFEVWEEVELSLPPPARSSCSATYDPVDERVIFGFGNSTTEIFTDLQALQL